ISPVRLERFLGDLFGHELAAWQQAERSGKALAEHVAEVVAPVADPDDLDTGAPPAIAPAKPVAAVDVAADDRSVGTRKVRGRKTSAARGRRWPALLAAAVVLVAG